jgi:hypothetical protein
MAFLQNNFILSLFGDTAIIAPLFGGEKPLAIIPAIFCHGRPK